VDGPSDRTVITDGRTEIPEADPYEHRPLSDRERQLQSAPSRRVMERATIARWATRSRLRA